MHTNKLRLYNATHKIVSFHYTATRSKRCSPYSLIENGILISFSFFIQILLSTFGYGSKTDWILFIQIFTFIVYFILSKFLIEKIIGTAFKIEELVELFNLQKVTYRTYVGLLLLPVDIILYYYDSILKNIPLFVLYIILALNVLLYVFSIKNYRKDIFGKLFYFILYLCTLEIAPYYFMYYWFTKGSV